VIAKGVGPGTPTARQRYGMAQLTPITKMMTHLTLASMDHVPQRVLVVVFCKEQSSVSAESWGYSSTVVELVPSVPKLVTFYHRWGAGSVLALDTCHVTMAARSLAFSGPFDAIILDPHRRCRPQDRACSTPRFLQGGEERLRFPVESCSSGFPRR